MAHFFAILLPIKRAKSPRDLVNFGMRLAAKVEHFGDEWDGQDFRKLLGNRGKLTFFDNPSFGALSAN